MYALNLKEAIDKSTTHNDMDLITHAKFYVNWLRGFSGAVPLKVTFTLLIRTTLKTQFCTLVQTVMGNFGNWTMILGAFRHAQKRPYCKPTFEIFTGWLT